MSALITIYNQQVSSAPVSTLKKLYIPLQVGDIVDYTYTYNSTRAATPLVESQSASLNITNLSS
jgi:hypothetical protein